MIRVGQHFHPGGVPKYDRVLTCFFLKRMSGALKGGIWLDNTPNTTSWNWSPPLQIKILAKSSQKWQFLKVQMQPLLTVFGPSCRPDRIFMVQNGWYRCPTYSTTCFMFDPHLWGLFQGPKSQFCQKQPLLQPNLHKCTMLGVSIFSILYRHQNISPSGLILELLLY